MSHAVLEPPPTRAAKPLPPEPLPSPVRRPPRRRGPRRYRFSVAKYEAMVAAGILDPNDRVELLEGELVEKMSIGPKHRAAVDRGGRRFSSLPEDSVVVSVQAPANLGHSMPEPDLQLLRPRPDAYSASHPTAEDILLIVEVADTTLAYDLGGKAEIYACAGIREYWVVDLLRNVLHVHRGPRADGRWESVTIHAADATVAPLAFPDHGLSVAALTLQDLPAPAA